MAYTTSKAKSGRQTVVSIGGVTGSSGTALTPIFELSGATPSGGDWDFADTTNFNSGVDAESLSTIRQPVTFTLEGNVVDADPGQIALVAAYNNGGKYDFTVQLAAGPGAATGTLYAFSAYVQSYFDFKIDVKSAITFTSKLRVNGHITVTAGS